MGTATKVKFRFFFLVKQNYKAHCSIISCTINNESVIFTQACVNIAYTTAFMLNACAKNDMQRHLTRLCCKTILPSLLELSSRSNRKCQKCRQYIVYPKSQLVSPVYVLGLCNETGGKYYLRHTVQPKQTGRVMYLQSKCYRGRKSINFNDLNLFWRHNKSNKSHSPLTVRFLY